MPEDFDPLAFFEEPEKPYIKRIDSDKVGRRYQITHEGQTFIYPSVTTVLNIISKPYLMDWAMGLCKKTVTESVAKGVPIGQALNSGCSAHKDVLKSAGSFGTIYHDAVEKRLLTGAFPSLTGMPPEIAVGLIKFDAWWSQAGLAVVETEMPTWSNEHEYAGTIDAVVKDGQGNLHILDHKTSNSLHAEYGLQGVAYKVAYQERTGQKVKDVLFDHMSKKTGKFQIKVYQECEHEELFEVFKAAIKLWKWNAAHSY